ncbi:MAG: radical SAM protein, partial [Adlercreutzia sp.]|nr:radical SAM protein [Adlercreutzia sp.]
AQDTGRWGQDFPEKRSLAWLADTLAAQFPDIWFRIMYLQPEGITDELLAVMAARPNICSYLDIPLQHVSTSILRAMNRAGSRASFEQLIERVQKAVPGITLRTTLIAGFPGETEEQFEELCDFVAEAPFDYVGVFPYSREEGTAAYDLPDQIDEDEKLERAQILRDTADAACATRIAERVGRTYEVLVEGVEEDGQRYGRAQCQAPEVDGVTFIERGEVGERVSVTIVDTLLYEMEGE